MSGFIAGQAPPVRGCRRAWLAILLAGVGLARLARAEAPAITFNRDVAPVVFQHCAGCHRPGQPAPFSLLSYADVKKRVRQIAEVTERGYMPPWLPEAGHLKFLNERRLTSAQIRLFRTWLDAGMPEGEPADLPALPHWPEGWQLGEPDLVARMPRAYRLAANGPDVYRNFVLPAPLKTAKHIRALEFRPGNGGIVHHAFIRVDRRGNALRSDGLDGQPGFEGMNLPEGVELPGGYFLSWQPGKAPAAEPPGFGWTLEPGQNLVVAAHLKPDGKPEDLQAEVGLYFTDIAPTNFTMIFALSTLNIDIPAGTNAYVVEDQFVLPMDVEILAVLPHAHYLAREMEGFAIRPGGPPQTLIRIPEWDFNWQGDYRFAEPVRLPAGTTLRMRYRYDNSAANPRNPNSPPKEVRYGPQSADEMAELWFQVRLADPAAVARLEIAYKNKQVQLVADQAAFRLERNPQDAAARTELGITQVQRGQPAAALESFRIAARDDPAADEPHYYLGLIYRGQKRLAEARIEFETAIRLNPKNAKAHGNLGFIFLEQGNLRRAEASFREALRLNPADELARQTLETVRRARAEADHK